MKQNDFVEKMKEKTRFSTREVELFIKEFKNIIYETLENGEKVQFLGFGAFEAKLRKQHEKKNPRTKEEMVIPESYVPKFKPGKEFKGKLNKKR